MVPVVPLGQAGFMPSCLSSKHDSINFQSFAPHSALSTLLRLHVKSHISAKKGLEKALATVR